MPQNTLILTNNIFDEGVHKFINNGLSKRTLFLTATQGLKRLRRNEMNLENVDLKTFSELKDSIYEKLREGPRFLSKPDQKFILTKVINSLFNGERQTAFYKIKNDLFELYEFLMEEEVGNISEEAIQLISQDFTDTERDIFLIYNRYFDALCDIKSGRKPSNIEIERLEPGVQYNLRSEIYTSLLLNSINDYEQIIFDGFLFLNDEQKKLLGSAICNKKDITFIAKTMPADKDNFLLNKLFLPLEEEFDIKFNIVRMDCKGEDRNNAISFVKNNYLDFEKETNLQLSDGFNVIEPFASRDREMNYIITCVSRYISGNCGGDRKRICKALAEDVGIVIGHEKEKYEQQLNVILRDIGVFFLNRECEEYSIIDEKCLKDVIYKRSEFIEAKIINKQGKVLSHQEKVAIFRKLYKGINISQKARSFINYPIGQYILEIYRIVRDGMSCEGFKKILYSNWYYNVGLDTVKYDKFIKEFQYLEPYLRKIKSPEKWLSELEKIKSIKNELNCQTEYRYHPLRDITDDTLEFLIMQIADTKNIVDNISKVFGNINVHLKALNDNFMIDEILTNSSSNEFEKEIIKNLKEVIDKISKSNLINNIDSKYFSDNIRSMLMDYEREKAESSADELTLNVVNLENMQKFRLTFFCMMEEDKYPRQFRLSFPYDENILEILKNEKYGIEKNPSFIKSLDYHLELEKYLFLNVLDFTKDRMIITQTEEENGKELSNSIYIEDIFSMFKQDIKYIKLKEQQIRKDQDYQPKTEVTMAYKDTQPIKLADLCAYYLCPKIYYYTTNPALEKEISYQGEWMLNLFVPGLIYYKTLKRLGAEGMKTHRIYSLNNIELLDDINKYLSDTMEEELKYFDFISKFEKKDIKRRVESLISAFIKRNCIDKDNLFISFSLKNEEIITVTNAIGKERKIIIDGGLIIKNEESGLTMNYDITSQMDFLVKSAGGDYYDFVHFKDIFNKLLENNPTDDRIALISYLFLKINVQLNVPRFKNDGLLRVRELARHIIKQKDDSYVPSSYCRYCKFENICKMKEKGAV